MRKTYDPARAIARSLTREKRESKSYSSHERCYGCGGSGFRTYNNNDYSISKPCRICLGAGIISK